MFELGEDLLHGVQVRRVFRQEEQFGADRADELTNGLASVAAQVVRNDDVTGPQRGQESLLDIGSSTSPLAIRLTHAAHTQSVMRTCFPFPVMHNTSSGLSASKLASS